MPFGRPQSDPLTSKHPRSKQANCIDSTVEAEVVFASEVEKLRKMDLKPQEQLTLEPYERDHACVIGTYRPPPKEKASKKA